MTEQAARNALLTLIRPVHDELQSRFGIPSNERADCFSLAAGWQETKFAVRDQIVRGKAPGSIGPATGYWQFERNGGVAEILEAPQTREIAEELCRDLGVSPTRDAVWRFFVSQSGDVLACAFARLLSWKDRASLPAVNLDASQEAYLYYDRNWRPGAKRPNDWHSSAWPTAVRLVQANPRGAAVAPLPETTPPAAPPPPQPIVVGNSEEVKRLAAEVEALKRKLTEVGRILTSQ